MDMKFGIIEASLTTLQGEVTVHSVTMQTQTADAVKKMAELAQPYLDHLDLASAQMKNEIADMRAGCQTLNDEILARHTQVEDWANKVENEFKSLAQFAQEMKVQHQQVEQWAIKVEGDLAKIDLTALNKIPSDVIKGHVTAQLTTMRDSVQYLENNVKDLGKKVGHHTSGSMSDGGDRGRKGYLPEKSTVPKPMDSSIEAWRAWKEDVEDFLDDQNRGMQVFLKQIDLDKLDETVDDTYKQKMRKDIEDAGGNFLKVTEDQVQIWRALKKLTTGEANGVVTSVKGEDGFEAWRQLCLHFEPVLEARQGQIIAELGNLVRTPAKTIEETRKLVTELEKRKKRVEEITKEEVSQWHAKSVLLGILDPETKRHTVRYQGSTHTYQTFKNQVLTFANGNIEPDLAPEPMQIGRLDEQAGQGHWGPCGQHDHEQEQYDQESNEGMLGAMGCMVVAQLAAGL